jgi:hypothetical protein
MASINFLGGLKREFHHVKVAGADIDKPKYEGAMVLLKEEMQGCSFIIPQSAGWKYIEPKDNRDAAGWDMKEFDEIARKTLFAKQLGRPAHEWADDAAAIIMAEQMHDQSGFLYTLGYNLVKCCQLLNIAVSGPALAQLLMFIQDGLSALRTMPLHAPEASQEIGELSITMNDKTEVRPLSVSESEMAGVLR